MKITISLGVVPFAPHWVGLFVALVHNDNGGGDDPLEASDRCPFQELAGWC